MAYGKRFIFLGIFRSFIRRFTCSSVTRWKNVHKPEKNSDLKTFFRGGRGRRGGGGGGGEGDSHTKKDGVARWKFSKHPCFVGVA